MTDTQKQSVICEVSRCRRTILSSGLCTMHYSRRRRTGSSLGKSGRYEKGGYGTSDTSGLGVIKCFYCNEPVRDHKIRPCPSSGVSTFLTGTETLRQRRYRRKGGR